ncbi:hypothetical protein TCAL_10683 [Tigriopus californicus]|uniref:Uncharacterized protein n=1 Tax=Tigriopus californicus TaxID=6832 RepID=A0A553PG61_TIGCA|nr:uncharacterized protein LOC131880076 [Tigriopus californicus]TRY76663.1 hypothetical protein TCAL_10683 [Tigriopus californicus]|eukprot:TCALIF_10683-PA protein Name:"Protein of unknown function" AED:0.00 eAED:0.00 QI:369/1/1/1/0/0.5/2/79/138
MMATPWAWMAMPTTWMVLPLLLLMLQTITSSQGFTLKGQFMAQSDNLLIFDYSHSARRPGLFIPPLATTVTAKSAQTVKEDGKNNAHQTDPGVSVVPGSSRRRPKDRSSSVTKPAGTAVVPESFEEKRARILKRFMRI